MALSGCAADAISQTKGGLADSASQTNGAVACGAATASTVVAADERATKVIYHGESHGWEVSADSAHVTGAADLSLAVADGDATAALAAVTRIVFHRHWHIVRLRVLSRSGQLLADVGGPYIMAPVRGSLTYRGAAVGSYVMSVQDDVGYEKLVTRFTHLPIELYRDGQPLLGRDWPRPQLPVSPPTDGTTLTVRGAVSQTASFLVKQFPSGTARAVLAIPKPNAALAGQSCALVGVAVFGQIATDTAELFDLPRSFKSSVPVDQEYRLFVAAEGGLGPKYVFVRSGTVQIAGSFANGPIDIPSSGSFTFDGKAWNVFSFAPVPPARIYLLFPVGGAAAPVPSGTSGTSGTTQ
ncbi:MAG TPA: hypothetical protein VHM72_04455 [Solirubrobacteraceae bacterium]|nr:hypothetical protein [Solirubrobacteraceae bacterium]